MSRSASASLPVGTAAGCKLMYEIPRSRRRLGRGIFTDGGLANVVLTNYIGRMTNKFQAAPEQDVREYCRVFSMTSDDVETQRLLAALYRAVKKGGTVVVTPCGESPALFTGGLDRVNGGKVTSFTGVVSGDTECFVWSDASPSDTDEDSDSWSPEGLLYPLTVMRRLGIEGSQDDQKYRFTVVAQLEPDRVLTAQKVLRDTPQAERDPAVGQTRDSSGQTSER